MSEQGRRYLRFGAVMAVILIALGYLAYTGVQDSKSYYVTIKELNGMGNGAYSKRLRVAGNVQPGSIKRQGTHMEFLLVEQDRICQWFITAPKLRPTLSKIMRKRWRKATLDTTAFSTPPTFKPSAPPSTRLNSPTSRALLRRCQAMRRRRR